MRKILVIFAPLSLFLAGCVGTSLQVRTNPEGALVTEMGTGKQYMAPVTIKYNWDEKFVKDNCLRAKGYKATWPSGATIQTKEIITMCGGPKNYYIDLNRPPSHPELDKDMAHAMQLKQLQLQRERASNEAWNAAIQSWNQNTNRMKMTDCSFSGNSLSCMEY